MAKEAVLVIHGIGQQNPYETLDQFARGLIDQRERSTGQRLQPAPLLIAHEGWNEVAIRLDLGGQPTKCGATTLDLYEFYWAPYTEGKITYRQVLAWLRRAVLTPLRKLATSYELLEAEARPGRLGTLFVREILRIILLYLPVIALTVLLGYLLVKPDNIWSGLSGLEAVWRKTGPWRRAGLVAFLGLLTLIVTLSRSLRVLSREERLFLKQAVRGLSEQAAGRWRRYVWITLVVSILAGVLLGGWLFADLWGYTSAAGWVNLFAVILAAVGNWLKQILVGYVGDIAVYVNADAKAASYEARTRILADAREAILRLLRSPERYDRIVLAAHSLGSVIAYDLLNELLSEVRGSYKSGPNGPMPTQLTLQDLLPIQGLVTFGSPLDKIAYFFRTEVPPEQAVRAQILSFLHAFRRKPSGRSYGRYEFPGYSVPDPSPGFIWINVWANADPVSGHLDFYRACNPGPVACQFERDYPWFRWGRAHLDYWSDPDFYKIVADRLL